MSTEFDCSAFVERLKPFAATVDRPADDLIKAVTENMGYGTNEKRRSEMLPDVMRAIAEDGDDRIKDFLNGGTELDAIIEKDLELIKRAQGYFDDHGVAVITALFHASLPEAYLGRRGVQVLDITGELSNNWTRRVQETGQFLVNILSPTPDLWRQKKSSLSAGQFGAVAARRVRLTHAAVRWMLGGQRKDELSSLLFDDSTTITVWQARMIEIAHDGEQSAAAVEGEPLNQEDLLATLGTFTTVVVRALERLGLTVDDEDRAAFYFLWNVVGWHLGIGDRKSFATRSRPPETWPGNCLLPLAVNEMDCIYDHLSNKLQGDTPQGQRLAKALFQELAYPLPRAVQTAPAFVARYLIGNEKADQLAIEKGGYTELALSGTGVLDRLAQGARTKVVRRLSVELVSRYVTRYAIRAFISQSRWSERGLKIDPRVAGKWGIQMPPDPRTRVPTASNTAPRV